MTETQKSEQIKAMESLRAALDESCSPEGDDKLRYLLALEMFERALQVLQDTQSEDLRQRFNRLIASALEKLEETEDIRYLDSLTEDDLQGVSWEDTLAELKSQGKL